MNRSIILLLPLLLLEAFAASAQTCPPFEPASHLPCVGPARTEALDDENRTVNIYWDNICPFPVQIKWHAADAPPASKMIAANTHNALEQCASRACTPVESEAVCTPAAPPEPVRNPVLARTPPPPRIARAALAPIAPMRPVPVRRIRRGFVPPSPPLRSSDDDEQDREAHCNRVAEVCARDCADYYQGEYNPSHLETCLRVTCAAFQNACDAGRRGSGEREVNALFLNLRGSSRHVGIQPYRPPLPPTRTSGFSASRRCNSAQAPGTLQTLTGLAGAIVPLVSNAGSAGSLPIGSLGRIGSLGTNNAGSCRY